MITFSHNNNVAQRALKEAQYARLGGFELIVMLSSTKQILKTEGKLFVKNIWPSTMNSDLHKTFAAISPQLYVSIRRDQNGNSFGYGFVHYFNPEDVYKALQCFQGQTELILSKWRVKDKPLSTDNGIEPLFLSREQVEIRYSDSEFNTRHDQPDKNKQTYEYIHTCTYRSSPPTMTCITKGPVSINQYPNLPFTNEFYNNFPIRGTFMENYMPRFVRINNRDKNKQKHATDSDFNGSAVPKQKRFSHIIRKISR